MKSRDWLEKFDLDNADSGELILAFESAMHYLRETENNLRTLICQNYQKQFKTRKDRELQDDYLPYHEDERDR